MKNDFLLESGQKFISNVLGGAGARRFFRSNFFKKSK